MTDDKYQEMKAGEENKDTGKKKVGMGKINDILEIGILVVCIATFVACVASAVKNNLEHQKIEVTQEVIDGADRILDEISKLYDENYLMSIQADESTYDIVLLNKSMESAEFGPYGIDGKNLMEKFNPVAYFRTSNGVHWALKGETMNKYEHQTTELEFLQNACELAKKGVLKFEVMGETDEDGRKIELYSILLGSKDDYLKAYGVTGVDGYDAAVAAMNDNVPGFERAKIHVYISENTTPRFEAVVSYTESVLQEETDENGKEHDVTVEREMLCWDMWSNMPTGDWNLSEVWYTDGDEIDGGGYTECLQELGKISEMMNTEQEKLKQK